MNEQTPIDTSTVGGRIRFLRKAKKISMNELAEKILSKTTTISEWEKERNYPNAQALLRLSEYFGVSVDWLLKGDTSTKPLDISICKDESKKVIELAAYEQTAATHVEMRLMQNFPKTYLLVIETKDFEGYLQFLAWIEQNPPANIVLRIIRTLPEAEE